MNRSVPAAGLAVLTLALAGCSSSGGAHAHSSATASAVAGGHATLGGLEISGAIVPAPASPDVAAAYFTVTNKGSVADDLVSVTSDASTSTGLHTYSGASMVDLKELNVAAGGTVRLQVGGVHVMIMNPTHPLVAGQQVRLTLTFSHAGPVSVQAPVVATTGPQADDMGSMGADMSDMPGMG